MREVKLPSYVQIEPVGQCNLRCQMCAILYRQDGPPYGPPAFMDYDLFTRLVDGFPNLEKLHLQGLGEPTMVGAFPAGLSYINDIRPDQQAVEFWEGQVQPEIVEPESREWQRFHLHRAANIYHAAQKMPPGESRIYKVAWIAACILYDREKLLEVGGFSFWDRLPRFHSGEEVLVQNLLMRRWGGCAILPSGAYFSEMPSTVLNEQGRVDGHALDLLPEMLARYAPEMSKQPSEA